jgi:hypothetical protein
VGEERVLGNPREALRVDVDARDRRGRRTLLEQRADRLALVEPEAGDVDESDDVRCVGAERRDDLAAVGVGDENGRAALAREHVADPRDVIRKRGLRKLNRRDLVAVGLQALDDVAPAGPLGPRSVHEDDVR